MLRCGAPVPETTARPYRWSRTEYDRAVDAGVFVPDARLELVDGEILAMTPQGSRHFAGVELAADALREAFGAGCRVRVQGPLAAGDDSEPEPDVAVVEGHARTYRDAHPTTALLVVEVSDDSLSRDRTGKQRRYSRCGIREYWILALPDQRLEIHRDPARDDLRRANSAVLYPPPLAARPMARIVSLSSVMRGGRTAVSGPVRPASGHERRWQDITP